MDKEDRENFKTIAAALPKRLTDSSKSRSAGNSSLESDQAFSTYCLERAKILFACYRKGEAAEPEIYCAAVAAVLSDYPQNVIHHVTDPRTGIAAKIKWLPNIAEIKTAFDDLVESINAMVKRDRDLRNQFAARDEFEAEQENRKNRPTYAELAADCAKRGIMIGPVQHMTSAAEIKAFREQYGITDAQWNKIPNRK